jgi:hypothetical protein
MGVLKVSWCGIIKARARAATAATHAAPRPTPPCTRWTASMGLHPIVTFQYRSTTLYQFFRPYSVAVFLKWQSDITPGEHELNHFIPVSLSYSVAVFSKVATGDRPRCTARTSRFVRMASALRLRTYEGALSFDTDIPCDYRDSVYKGGYGGTMAEMAPAADIRGRAVIRRRHFL